MIVADTNLLVHYHVPGPQMKLADSVWQRDSDWVAPVLWRSEFCNVLAAHLRAGYLKLEEALEIAEAKLQAKQHQPKSSDVLALSSSSGCTACDCEFVVVARNLGVKLVTFDRALVSSFPGTAMSPADFAKSGSR